MLAESGSGLVNLVVIFPGFFHVFFMIFLFFSCFPCCFHGFFMVYAGGQRRWGGRFSWRTRFAKSKTVLA